MIIKNLVFEFLKFRLKKCIYEKRIRIKIVYLIKLEN